MSSLFYLPRQFVIDGGGDPRAGAKLYFYQAGTLTAQDTYSDSALTTPNTNPVVADSAGEFGAIYLSTDPYRVILKDSDDVTLWDQDNYDAAPIGFGKDAAVKSGNYTIVVADRGEFFRFTATATATLPSVADAGTGFPVAIANVSAGDVVTVDPGADTIDGTSSLVVRPSESALLTCNGTEWKSIVTHYAGLGRYALEKSGNYTIAIGDVGCFVVFTASATATLPSIANAGTGFPIAIYNSHATADVTVDPGADTINGAGSLTVGPGGAALLTSNGTEWKAVVMAHIDNGSFTGTWNGFTTTPTDTILYTKIGEMVILTIPPETATSNDTAFYISGVPAALTPTTQTGSIPVHATHDNTSDVVGGSHCVVNPSSQIVFSKGSLSFGDWTASGEKGIPQRTQIVYRLD